jgi:GAF domain-containing protein/HAMP domain-containing protein
MSKNQKSDFKNPNTRIPPWRQLRWNLILFFVLLAVLPVAIAITVTLVQANQQATEQVERQLQSIAELKRGQIVRWLEASQGVLTLFLADRNRVDQFVNFVVFSSPEAESVTRQTLNNVLGEAVKAQPLFEEFFVYNTKGEILAASNPVQLGKIVTRQPYFSQSLKEPYVQPPYYALGTADLAMLITQPLIDQRKQIVGVLAGRLNLNTLGQIMTDRTGLSSSGETYLVSLESHYLVTPSRFESEGYIPTRAYFSEGINRVLDGEDGAGTYPSYREPPVNVIGAYRWIPQLQVGLLAEVEEAEALAPYTRARNISTGIALVAVLAAVGIGFYSATRISRPIAALTQVATRITDGNLEQRAEIAERNEIGLLANAFNTMTAQLRELIGSLEDRVTARTERLEIVATLGERLSAILKVEELLAEVVNQIKDKFDYYHAHIYLLDDEGQNLVIAEGVGEAGAEMKAKGHSIPLNAPTSLVARAARTGEIVTVDNVREAEDWLPNPLLPNTYSEMAVPIVLEGQVVGVLDVQQDKIAGLDEADASLLRSLVNQVAVAIRNARLFDEVETALAEAYAAQARYTEQSWEKAKIVTQHGQYHYARPGAPLLDETTLIEAKQQGLTQFKPTVVTINGQNSHPNLLVAPVTLRNQAIGALQLHPTTDDQAWTEDDLLIVEAVSEELAQIAENIRLFEETRQRATREATIREITDKLRTAPTLDMLLETAARELGQRLGVRHTVLELGLKAGPLAGNAQNGQGSGSGEVL